MVSSVQTVWLTSRTRGKGGVRKMTLFVTFTTLCDISEHYNIYMYINNNNKNTHASVASTINRLSSTAWGISEKKHYTKYYILCIYKL